MNNLGHHEGRTEYEHEDTVNPLAPGGERDDEPVLLPSVAAVAAADEAISMAERRAISQAKIPFNNSRMLAYKQRLEGRVADTMETQEFRTFEGESFIPDYAPRSSASLHPIGIGSRSPSRIGATPDPSRNQEGKLPPVVNQEMYSSALSELQGIRFEIAHVEKTLDALKAPVERTTLGRPIIRKNPAPLRKVHRNDTFAERKKEWEAAKEFSAIIPVSRGEAVILEQTLEELLPAGIVTAALRTGKNGAPGFDVHLFEKQYELVDMVLREAARQVQAGCHERGSVLEKLRNRYNEFFAAMKNLLFKLQQNYSLASTDVKELTVQLTVTSKELEDLKYESMRLKSEEEYLHQRLENFESEGDAYKETAEEKILNLQSDNQLLEQELSHFEERLASANRDKEDAVSSATRGLEEQLSITADERDDLLQRSRFLERQLNKAREERGKVVSWDHQATQTDAIQIMEVQEEEPSSEDSDEEGLDDEYDDYDNDLDDPDEEEPTSGFDHQGTKVAKLPGTGARSESGRSLLSLPGSHGEAKEAAGVSLEEKKVLRKKRAKAARKKARKEAEAAGEAHPSHRAQLGGFGGLMLTKRVGRIKPRGQVLKTIAQIYSEKIITDQVDDRERNPRMSLPLFVYDWHLNRYGLRNLAEMNLMDLIASIKHWAGSTLKVKLFGQFCAILRSENSTVERLNFYLYCMQVLSPNVTLLFPEAEDAGFWLKPLRVLDVVRVVFSNFGDAAALRQFMTTKVETLIENRSKMYDADKILYMLLEEWQRRAERNTAQLKALFRAGDQDIDGLLTYDEFLSVVRLADGLRTEREIVRMYREALLLSPDGVTIDVDSFVKVARAHGLSSWKIDYRLNGLPDVVNKDAADPEDNNGNADALYAMLDHVLDNEDLDEQIVTLKYKIGEDHEAMKKVLKQYAFFQHKYKDRDDVEGTWLAFRVVVGEVRAAFVRYRGGMRKMVGAVKTSFSSRQNAEARPNSTYTSPLITMLQQSQQDETGRDGTGREDEQQGDEPSALNMMKGSSGGIDEPFD